MTSRQSEVEVVVPENGRVPGVREQVGVAERDPVLWEWPVLLCASCKARA